MCILVTTRQADRSKLAWFEHTRFPNRFGRLCVRSKTKQFGLHPDLRRRGEMQGVMKHWDHCFPSIKLLESLQVRTNTSLQDCEINNELAGSKNKFNALHQDEETRSMAIQHRLPLTHNTCHQACQHRHDCKALAGLAFELPLVHMCIVSLHRKCHCMGWTCLACFQAR